MEMKFQRFENFPLYNEKYKFDRHSITPIQPKLILSKGKIPFAVFFVTKGEAYASNSTGKYIYFKFPAKSVFGETHVLSGIPYSYSIYYSDEIGCSAYVVPSHNFLKVCQRYPHSFQVLLQRAIKRRKIFRQFKFAALNDIIKIALEKGSVAHVNLFKEKEKLYSILNPKLVVNKIVFDHVCKRITNLKNIKELEEQKTLNELQTNPGKNYVQLSASQLLEKERELREKHHVIPPQENILEENKEHSDNPLESQQNENHDENLNTDRDLVSREENVRKSKKRLENISEESSEKNTNNSYFQKAKNSRDTNRKMPELLSLDMSDNNITDEDLKNFSFQSIKNKDLTIKRTFSDMNNIVNENDGGNDRYHRRLCSKDFELDSPVGYDTVERFVLPQDEVSDIEPIQLNENTKEFTFPTKNSKIENKELLNIN